MTDLAGALQIAMDAALSAVDGLPPVASETPINGQDQVDYPFVLLGDDLVRQIGSKTKRLERHEVSVHVCMQSTDKLTVRGNQELVRAALQDQPLSAPGVKLSRPEAGEQTTTLLDDGSTYVGTQLFVILAQEG